MSKDLVFGMEPTVLFDHRRSAMDASLEGTANETEVPPWALQLVRKRRRDGYDNVFESD